MKKLIWPAVATMVVLAGVALLLAGLIGRAGRRREAQRYNLDDLSREAMVRASVSSSGRQANGDSGAPSLSADGRFVAFLSNASNLVPNDTNGHLDVFVRDRQTGRTERVNVSSSGEEANARSLPPSISADGRFVAFWSHATNLAPGDANRRRDVFVHDRETRETRRVEVDSPGGGDDSRRLRLVSISADGRFVAFGSDATDEVPVLTDAGNDILVNDRKTGATEVASPSRDGGDANGSSGWPSISADGRFVAFWSVATNLVVGDTNDEWDIFVRDRSTGRTERVSVSSSGDEARGSSGRPQISADGRFVAFGSYATNLVPDDTSHSDDVFVHDRVTGKTVRASLSSCGKEGNNDSRWPSISSDGRFVAFASYATNLVPGDTDRKHDLFVRDMETGTTRRLTRGASAARRQDHAESTSISSYGHFVAFGSFAADIVPDDTNGKHDVFVVRNPLVP